MRFTFRSLALFAAFGLATASLTWADALLEQGVVYVRARTLDSAALAVTALSPHTVVLDLRHTTAASEAKAALAPMLARQPAATPTLFLIGPATPAAVAEALTPLPPGLVTLGVATARPAPVVVVQQSAEADAAAYTAYEKGTDLETLISGKVEKERYDEAALVQEFRQPENSHASAPAAATPAAEQTPAPPSDRVLQRAVNLHHVFLALQLAKPAAAPKPPRTTASTQ